MKNLIIALLLITTLSLGGFCIFERIQLAKEMEITESTSIRSLYPKTVSTIVSANGVNQRGTGNPLTFIDFPGNDHSKTYRLLFRLTYCGSTKTEDLYLISKNSVPELKDNDIIRFSGGTQIILKTDFSTCALTTEPASGI